MTLFGLKYQEFSIEDCSPPNKTFVLVDLYDSVSGKHKVVSSFYEKGVFWDSDREDSWGVEHSSRDGLDQNKIYFDWKVIKWAKIL